MYHVRRKGRRKFYSKNLQIIIGKSRHKWENTIKMYFDQMEYKGLEWIDLAQEKVHW
jgi:hypothetical protein